MTPVLSPAEAAVLAHDDGVMPRVHPVLSGTAPLHTADDIQTEGHLEPGVHTAEVLGEWLGMDAGKSWTVLSAGAKVSAKL